MANNTYIRLFRIAYPVTALGPGNRVALWVAGCLRRCPGCISPEMQNNYAGKPVRVVTLAERLTHLVPDIDGITISGGEPFEQASALASLLSKMRKLRPQWTVIVYTGYRRKKVEKQSAGARKLLGLTDILIDGAYRETVPQTHPLAGSGNQSIHFLSVRSTKMKNTIRNCRSNAYNFGVDGNGKAMLIGILRDQARVKVHTTLGITKTKDKL